MPHISRLSCLFLSTALLPVAAAAQATWSQLQPATSPSARAGTTGASDGAGMLMFGGQAAGTAYLNDLWRFDGTSWTNLTPAAGLPAGRDWYACSYDSFRQVLVVFGGRNAAGVLGDTWEWHSSTGWTQRTTTTTPTPRRWAAMAYDSQSQRCVMFGGENGASTYNNETWAYDGNDWTLLAVNGAPTPRGRGKLAYDMMRDEMVYFGGRNVGGALGDTFRFDGQNWQRITTATIPNGSGIFEFGFTHDLLRDRYVLMGGTTSGPTLPKVWEFDGTDWIDRGTTTGLRDRTGTCLAFVLGAGRSFLFGGFSNTQLGDTWEYQTNQFPGFAIAGSGCAGSAGTPALNLVQPAWAGSSFVVDVANTVAGAQTWVMVGFAPTSLPLAFLGFPACVVQADPVVALPAPIDPGTGRPTRSIPLPNDPTLGGATFYLQGLTVEVPSFRLAVSARGDATIGLR
jgi:hypothetical protein